MAERALSVEIAGEQLQLHAHRAVVWPARATVFIADLHLGKSEFFRRSGIAAPEGSSAQDLERLGGLIEEYAARRVVLLGDFVHSTFDGPADHEAVFTQWRSHYPKLHFTVVAGNHDRCAAGRVLTAAVEWSLREIIEPPFVLRHHPSQSADGFVLCGHVHPVASLRGMRRERTRVPVFWRQAHCLVLPAFSEFTGGAEVELALGERMYAAVDGAVWTLPPRN